MATTQTSTALQAGNVFATRPSLNTTTSTTATATATSPTKPTEQRTRPYKDFLTPALHRRFTRAALLTLAACYLTSILIRRPSLLWIWNPFSLTGIRALLLFLPCLAVFIVRVSNMHIGPVTTGSKIDTVWQTITSWKSAHTLAWFMWSAWFFGEVYLWSQGPDAHLEWVDRGRKFEEDVWEWPILNESPLFLRFVWLWLALLQTSAHLLRDEDGLSIPQKDEDWTKKAASKLPEPLQELRERMPRILIHTFQLLCGLVVAVPIYWLFIRKSIWPWFSVFAGLFFSGLSSDSSPPGPKHQGSLSIHTFASSILLITLWNISNAVFTIFVIQPPLRREQPLTTEMKDAQGNISTRSRDPNGSLLNGLKSKKEVTKAFAFWELCVICEKFEARRKTIYTDVDRKEGSTWAQISKYCLGELDTIQARIDKAQAPSAASAAQHEGTSTAREEPRGLPKIANRGVVENGNVLQKPAKADFAQHIGNAAKSIGQSPDTTHVVQARARKAIEWGADRLLSKSEQQQLTRQNLASEANSTITRVLQSPVGEPFRKTFDRKVSLVVLGTAPHGNRANIVHASRALSALCVNSLKEDDYGQVARSIPIVLRTYTAAITAVSTFVAGVAPHWTDVEFRQRDRRVKDVDEVVLVLKAGLEGILLAFGEYADAVGVTKRELREAREAVGRGAEMRKV
ncbi:nucleoporin protein Ndc1-Nup [Neohortaea acidophila]|uniref:Nucleoporin protein Ndc1-Nup n=1 Tax=Neohortaea acidophila TaxID=245834 RepID=A0A6A6PJY2_9PEZI|nr:nucleoporin protein Ndc1-Nup [Neohortaea acidophila]KAF2480011.1 nucleoporin protein Ndc1-Nup [Neohortaea acidophila]